VVTGLARACLEEGHKVEVILPFYQCLPETSVANLRHLADFEVPKVGFSPPPSMFKTPNCIDLSVPVLPMEV